ncbi:MAG: chemotaxis protein CheD [Chloroflexota bacterium]|nr:chemotaxis protein CheD [Chloroflexota bacterium]
MVVLAPSEEQVIVANLGEIHISNAPEVVLSCLGVGSCIALCIYDPQVKVGGIAHIVLPNSNGKPKDAKGATKYADIAVPHLLNMIRESGALRSRLQIKLAGGSQMFVGGSASSFNTGENNYESVKQVLADEALKISAADVGGNKGRTIRLSVATGRVTVKTVGGEEKEL